ncbi:helix-turn-helix transcriptional regulator [Enterococcus cecorum]|uniref:Helix-turn-helix transcriptional regulator n=4 Tax=Enterococcus cecorum TaxID=44008 RepID=A0AAW8TMQ0_9ENTE|nr:helix-turn-helix transcriptional regulator [Enterococcus cecorum]MDT2796079.1 helix-turn-helix transcriptional regulator [Enterococcus cecorum]MDZ5504379.1 helix-turn-helix transcriptional regulator [Enterococcus cecorum]MDZ5531770.1 helix-turn-helix transcriptional regulator [Enterococcus cecorum]MDZ5545312.1 helix-turn-helix transcriptional regulator [Enterococcus cecorum]MDZ5552162.1 helix-turn-helix transcriptional regulator [Enterococcus cecorum]
MYQDERKLDFKPLGIAIKKAREAKGWTQEYLAQLVDLTPRSIMYIENRGQHPRLNKFYLITTLLDLLNKLSQIDDKMSQCINMLAKGYKKREILESLDLGLAKTQGYEFIKKAQNLSKKIINGDL